jgi:hypothetical protein
MEKPIGNDDLVWYVAYGSNLYSRRFQEYLTKINHQGPVPISKPYAIAHNIYFDRFSKKWNGGVAFLNHLEPGYAYGRAYQLTYDAFKKIQKEEGWYPVVVQLPLIDGKPAFTFTQVSHGERSKPSDLYLSVIYKGLSETYSKEEILNLIVYLNACLSR